MKKHHTTIVLLTLFFTGLIVLWWAEYAGIPTGQELDASADLVLPALKSVSTAEIRRIEIDRRPAKGGGEATPSRIVFERRGDGWQMTRPMDVAADPSRLETLAQNLKNLTKSTEAGTITDPAAEFGLEPPAATIRAYGARTDAPLAELDVGRAVRDRLYVRPTGKRGIEVVDSRLFKGIDEAPPDWRERSIFNMATFQVSGLSVKGPGRDLTAERVAGNWKLVSPIRAPGDPNKMEEVLGELTSLRVSGGDQGFVADNVRDLASYGLDPEHAVRVELVSFINKAKPQAVLVGKPVPDQPGKVYALPGGQDDVVAVDGKGFRELGLDPNTLRSTKVVAFEPARAEFLRVEALGRTFDLARTAGGWEVVNPPRGRADEAAIGRLLTGLRDLEASEFFKPSKVPGHGLDRPSVTVKLWQSKRGTKPPAKAASEPGGELVVDLKLGRQDVAKKTLYGRVDGDSTVLALPDAFAEALPQNEFAFQDRSLLNLSLGTITRLTIVRDGQRVVLAPSKSGAPNQWLMLEPVKAPADTESITKALVLLSKLHAERLVSDKPDERGRYGLQTPTLTVSWSTAQPSPGTTPGELPETTLKVGSRVERSESWYAALSDRPLVFTLSEAVVLPFREEFRSRDILSFAPKSLERLTLRWSDRSLSFDRHPTPRGGVSDWDPAPGTNAAGFDLSRINALANDLARLKTRKFLQYEGPLPKSSGLASPRLTVEYTLRGDPTTHQLRVGNPYDKGGEYLATTASGNEGMVFVVSGTGWGELVNPGGSGKSAELPRDVFAPGPGKPPG